MYCTCRSFQWAFKWFARVFERFLKGLPGAFKGFLKGLVRVSSGFLSRFVEVIRRLAVSLLIYRGLLKGLLWVFKRPPKSFLKGFNF